MSSAFILLITSLAILPLSILDGPLAGSIIAIVAVASLAAIGISARAADVLNATRVARHLWLLAAVPAIWMIVQVLPLPFWAHPVWVNANEALTDKSLLHISIDLGRTINALSVYLATLGLFIAALLLGRDRRRAEIMLLALTGSAALTAGFSAVVRSAPATDGLLAAVSSVLIILSLALTALAIERLRSRRAEGPPQALAPKPTLIVSGIALSIGLGGLFMSATLNIALAALFGALTFASILSIRRRKLSPWSAAAFVLTMMAAAAMVITARYDPSRALSPLLQFATGGRPEMLSSAQRVISDVSWRGTGAGTYEALAMIYQDRGEATVTAPTTAAALVIELGWPMGLFTLLAALGLAIRLALGALRRGRDSFYAAAAAAFLGTLWLQAFCDVGMQSTPAAAIGAVLVGLGLAQSTSSTAGG